jgi:predicted RNase H-like HicB family nuclease
MTEAQIERRIQDLLRLPYHRLVVGDPEDGYLAHLVEWPGCMSGGLTPAEAMANLEEAMATWAEAVLRDGFPIPPLARGNVVIAA